MRKSILLAAAGLMILAANSVSAACPPGSCSFTGTVSCNGQPVAGVAVTVTGTNITDIQNGVTDANGNFEVCWKISASPFSVTVTFTKAGYSPQSVSLGGTSCGSQTGTILMCPPGTTVPMTSAAGKGALIVLIVAAGAVIYRRRRRTAA